MDLHGAEYECSTGGVWGWRGLGRGWEGGRGEGGGGGRGGRAGGTGKGGGVEGGCEGRQVKVSGGGERQTGWRE